MHVRVSPVDLTMRASMPSSTSRSTIQSPAVPATIPTTVTEPPRVAAARAAFKPLPPATATVDRGRWMAPAVSRSSS